MTIKLTGLLFFDLAYCFSTLIIVFESLYLREARWSMVPVRSANHQQAGIAETDTVMVSNVTQVS